MIELLLKIYFTFAFLTILATPYGLHIESLWTGSRSTFQEYYRRAVNIAWFIIIATFVLVSSIILIYCIWNVPLIQSTP